MNESSDGTWTARRMARWMAAVAAGTAVIAVGVTALLINIFEKRQEARNPFFRVVELTDDTEDPAQ